jgi:Ca-activated chloride channel homolog
MRITYRRVLLSPMLLALAVGCSSSDAALNDTGEDDFGESGGNPAGTASNGAGDSAYEGGEPNDDGGATSGDQPTTGAETGDESSGEPAACDAETPVVLYLSPDDSNSTSSPVQAREAVLRGTGLSNTPIRTWEFLNYYGFDYPRAEPGAVVVTPQLARVGDSDDTFTLQIGVSSERIANADRPLMNITLVLDESGSMEGTSMEMQKAACRALAGSLRKGDVVSMVGWDTENAVKMEGHVITAKDDPVLLGLIDDLAPGGGTDLNGGLNAGYELAHKQFDPTRINRVVLISDGVANAGVTDIETISGGAGDQDKDGIYLVGVGVGEGGNYNDALMDAVTDAGRGASLFIPSAAEADKMFGDRFVSTMHVAARDVQVQLDMPPGFEIVKFSGEEYSTDPAEVQPQHLAPNDAMVFHQTVSTCAPDQIGETAEIKVTARYLDARTFEARETSSSLFIGEAVAEAQPQLLKGAAVYEYAEALKLARDEPNTPEAAAGLQLALNALAAAEASNPADPDLAEIRGVLEAL